MDKAFNFYHTSACHLCELALALIEPYEAHLQLVIQFVDIAESDALIEQYGVRIPVLQFAPTRAELAWPFDEQQLHQFLSHCLG